MCRTRQFAKAGADAVFAGHYEAAGASGQALALAALQQLARCEVISKCISLRHRVQAVKDDVLADLIAWVDDIGGVSVGKGTGCAFGSLCFPAAAQAQDDKHRQCGKAAVGECVRHLLRIAMTCMRNEWSRR